VSTATFLLHQSVSQAPPPQYTHHPRACGAAVWTHGSGTLHLAMQLLRQEGVRDRAFCVHHLFQHEWAMGLLLDHVTNRRSRICTYLAAELLHMWCAEGPGSAADRHAATTPATIAALVVAATIT
jgi:hypothetical protein